MEGRVEERGGGEIENYDFLAFNFNFAKSEIITRNSQNFFFPNGGNNNNNINNCEFSSFSHPSVSGKFI